MLAALGVLVILGLLGTVFLAHMKLETAYGERDARRLKAQYLARAGVEDAIARLEVESPQEDAYTDVWWTGASPGTTPLGEGGYTVAVTDESSRINVLTAPPPVLSAILGGDKEAVAAVVNLRSSKKIFDVEDFRAANLSADALSRITTLGTVLGDGKVNINTANADVLAALPGMDQKAAQMIVDFRKGPDGIEGTKDDFVFASPADLVKVPGLTPVRVAPVIPLVKVNSNIFRAQAVGSLYRSPRIATKERATAVLERDNNHAVTITSWQNS
jgi:type II secretory pathway component PulK